jgi:hypothetical protein
MDSEGRNELYKRQIRQEANKNQDPRSHFSMSERGEESQAALEIADSGD